MTDLREGQAQCATRPDTSGTGRCLSCCTTAKSSPSTNHSLLPKTLSTDDLMQEHEQYQLDGLCLTRAARERISRVHLEPLCMTAACSLGFYGSFDSGELKKIGWSAGCSRETRLHNSLALSPSADPYCSKNFLHLQVR